MHPSSARRLILILSTVALLFTLDAAVEARVEPSRFLGLVVLGLVFGAGLMHLAAMADRSPRRRRHGALVALNAVGATPALLVLGLGAGLQEELVPLFLRGTVAWGIAAFVWTALIIWAARRSSRVPMIGNAPPWLWSPDGNEERPGAAAPGPSSLSSHPIGSPCLTGPAAGTTPPRSPRTP